MVNTLNNFYIATYSIKIMKSVTKLILSLFARVIAFILHPYIVKFFSIVVTYIISEYIAKQLKQSSNNFIVSFPITSIGLKYISIGDNFNACARFRLEAYDQHMENRYNPSIIIGDNVRIGYDCHIGCVNKIFISNNVLIASKVFITDHLHGDTTKESLALPPNSRKVVSKGPVVIEDNVWIGEGVAILPNVTIGRNSIIGANAVVTKDVPPNCVVAGNPAKVIKNISN